MPGRNCATPPGAPGTGRAPAGSASGSWTCPSPGSNWATQAPRAATSSPTPAEALSLSLVLCTTACLLSSSATVHHAEKTLGRGNQGGFILWWAATIVLGVVFLGGTAFEWHDLIYRHHLTISRNLFGTTYYTLVGLHALHVTGGVIVMLVVLGLALGRQVTAANREGVGLVSWYWHFVDAVWLVVFTVVYLVGR